MNSKTIIFVLFGVSAFLAGLLIYRTQTKSTYAIPSLNDNWDLLEKTAYQNQNDSYLVGATFDVNGKMPYLISTYYYSPRTPSKMFYIEINDSGKVIAVSIERTAWTSNNMLPIHRKDLTNDSVDALKIFTKDKSINSCLISSNDMIVLDLHWVNKEVLTWVLSLWNCPEHNKSNVYYLNAKTGELVYP